jgi:hypothetical protein
MKFNNITRKINYIISLETIISLLNVYCFIFLLIIYNNYIDFLFVEK